ncbi:MAG: hypothetical protein WDM89_04510 [Rhizomicrobium sp.]
MISGGAVVLMHDLHTKTAERTIGAGCCTRSATNSAATAEHHIEARDSPDFVSHEAILVRSAFSRLERISVFVTRALSADDIVGLPFSLSTSSPQKLGARKDEFEARLRARLAELSPDGQFIELAEMTALIATRAGRTTMKYSVSIDVPNLDDGLKFYRDALGLAEIARPIPIYAVLKSVAMQRLG